MLGVTHPIDPGMKYAASLISLNNLVKTPVAFNGIPEKAAIFEDFMSRCQNKNYSIRTREAYWGWVKRFILFHRKRDPSEMGLTEIEQFLAYLDMQGRATASTRNQALSALLFLYREVLHLHPAWMANAVRIKLPTKLSVVLTADEVDRVLSSLNGSDGLIASLLYGTGMHVMECLRLRVKDISIGKHEINVRDVRGELARRFWIPPHLHQALKVQMEKVLKDHAEDMNSDWQGVYMPEPSLIDYPNVGKSLEWQYVFAAKRLAHEPCDGKIRRYHVDEREFQRTLANAALAAGIDRPVSSHALGTSFAKQRPSGSF